jgi:hypothetical protein
MHQNMQTTIAGSAGWDGGCEETLYSGAAQMSALKM